jgi:hypothetical protein
LMLTSYIGSHRSLSEITSGKYEMTSELVSDIINGNIECKDVNNYITEIISKEVISWLRSLPVCLVFASPNEHPEFCTHINILTHGSIDPDNLVDARMITEEIAIWSNHTAVGALNGNTILYSIFKEEIKPSMVSKLNAMKFDKATGGYKKVEAYNVNFKVENGALYRILLYGGSEKNLEYLPGSGRCDFFSNEDLVTKILKFNSGENK